MRVTQNMISANVLQNLNKSYAELDKYFSQLNTGKKMNRPSDDPVAAFNGMGYRTELSRVEQYQRNASEIHSWYDNSEAALEQITSGLQRVRYLAVQANNGTYDYSERENIAEEVKQVRLDLIEMANMKVNDKYIFNGTDTENPPIHHENGVIDYENSNFNRDNVAIEVSSGTYLDANVNGEAIFGELTAQDGSLNNLFSMMDGFIEKLNNNDTEVLDESINEIDNFLDGIINTRADLGARMNRLELVENRLDHQAVIATSTLSKNEDVNYAEAITNLMIQQSIHRAALASGSQIIQPTLIDFLR